MGIVSKSGTKVNETARFIKYLASYIPLLLLHLPLGHAADSLSEEKEFALTYGDEEMLSIATGANQPVARAPAVASVITAAQTNNNKKKQTKATGANQPVARAPAVASVITAAQIKEIGATDLDQILDAIPGLHVARSARGYNPIYV